MSSLRTICSCTNIDEPIQHAQWCQLWSDYSFKHGTAIWSREFFRLVGFLEWASGISKENRDLGIDSLSEMWPATDRLRSTEHTVEDGSREEVGVADRAERLVQLMDEVEIEAQMNAPGEEVEDDFNYDCPHCGNFSMNCAECGFATEDCECGDLTAVYCTSCSHIFELAVRDAKDEVEEVASSDHPLMLVEETEPDPELADDDEEDDEPFLPPMCYCDPPKKFCCMEDGVARWKEEDEWHYISKYDPMCTCKPKKTTYCWSCGVQFRNGRWQFDPSHWEVKNDTLVRKNKSSVGGMYGSWGGGYVQKCRHKEQVVSFPNGTKVWASSCHERKPEELAPDFGLYLANSWKPACLAYAVAWPDMNLPAYPEVAANAILDVFEKAKNGEIVEVGCIGGHGRTGTALACMAVLGGVKPKEAVQWVRDNYCEEAVESDRQEWWVLWFNDFVTGSNEAGPEPPKPTYKSTTATTHSQQEHYDMWKDGKGCKKSWDAKEKKNVPCSFWDKDVDTFQKGEFPKGGGSGKAPAKTTTNSAPVATSVTPTSSPNASVGKAGDDDSRFHTPATCLKLECGASMPFGITECPDCSLLYAPGFWTWHVERQRFVEETEADIATLAGIAPAPKEEECEVGSIKDGFVWTGPEIGWVALDFASEFLPDVQVVNRRESNKERKRRLRKERNKKNRRS